MSIGQYLLGGAAGLVFGLLVAAGNTLLTRRSLQRAKQSQATVMGTSGLRQVINLAALVLVYLLRKVVPLPRIAHWYQRHFIVRMAGPCFRPGTGPAETLRTGLPERPALRHGSIDQTKNVAVLKSSFEIFSYPKRISPGQTAVYTS